MTDPTFSHSRRARRGIARIQKAHNLSETIEAVFYAQRWRKGLQFLLVLGAIGDTIFVLVARPYWVAATKSHVVMFRAGRFLPRVGPQMFDAELDMVRIEPLGRGPLRRRVLLRALGGGEHEVSVHRVYWKELDRMQELLAAGPS